jgi:rhodanese-related sulfurtransferase
MGHRNIRVAFGAGLVVGLALLTGCESGTTDRDIKPLTAGDALRLYESAAKSPRKRVVLFVDPRSPDEFRAGHIPEARNLLLSDVPLNAARNPDISAYGTIVVYGNNPASFVAKGVTKRLIANGYDGVKYFPGGLTEWVQIGGPIVKEPEAAPTPPAPAPPAQPDAR